MSGNIALDSNDVLMQKMQRYRMDIIEGVMEAPAENPGERIVDKDPKMLRVALVAMGDVDNSIHKQARLDLDKQAQENEGDFQRQIAGAINFIMEKGGMALADAGSPSDQMSAPAPQLANLPMDQISSEEAHIGVEHIDYDDIMAKK